MSNAALVWFRRDLRIEDNPALDSALKTGLPVCAVYLPDVDAAGSVPIGRASKWWLHFALKSLREGLNERGISLHLLRGQPLDVIPTLCQKYHFRLVSWNKVFEPDYLAVDRELEKHLDLIGVQTRAFNSQLLLEPSMLLNQSSQPYQVYTPFYRELLRSRIEPSIQTSRDSLHQPFDLQEAVSLENLDLLPKSGWDAQFFAHWQPTLPKVRLKMNTLCRRIQDYAVNRDIPAIERGTTRFSTYLHFGQISPRQLFERVKEAYFVGHPDAVAYVKELAWREFAYYTLFFAPQMLDQPLQEKFNRFPWNTDDAALSAWKMGRTGIPLVDAGMRQLWKTGWMHNRVRMIVASFLVKHLGISWKEGTRWFHDTLLDADLANNTMNWQWVAGCGRDAAPFFRIFNPVTQALKFDPDGVYIRKFLPEIGALPDRYLFAPWETPIAIQKKVGVVIGRDYPAPIIDLKAGRNRALENLKGLSVQ
jgi:deoxyribodipyrimidine photo-lyase